MRRSWIVWVLLGYLLGAAIILVLPVVYSGVVIRIWSWLRDGLGLTGFGAGWVEFVANVALFLPLGLLLTLCVRRPWVGFVGAVALSAAAEFVQLMIPGRVASLRDVVANALGAAVGALIAWLIIAIARSRAARGPVRP